MKIKNLFLASLVVLALGACNNEETQTPGPVSINGGDLKLRIDLKEISKGTRTADDYVKTGDKSLVNTADLYLLEGVDANQKVLSAISLEAADVAKLTSDDGYIIEEINGNITGVAVVVNKKEGNALAAAGTPVSNLEDATLASEIVDIQPNTQNKGVSNAPMFGFAGITDTENTNPATGNQLYQSSVTITPVIARIQVYGAVQTDAPDFKVTRIFVDNFKTKKPWATTTDVLFTVGQSTDLDNLLTPYPFFDEGEDLQDKDKVNGVYAYHIYPQTPIVPGAGETIKPKDRGVKLIIEMQYTKDGATVTEYGTFRLVTESGTPNVLNDENLEIEAAKVYTVNLGKIDWTGDGTYVDPDDPNNGNLPDEDKDKFVPGEGGSTPNSDERDLKVVVTVQEWTEIEVVPQN